MSKASKKNERLTLVAKLYYEENKTQNEIAREINVSRPMVSKLIAEARELGIVTISIGDPEDGGSELGKVIRARFGLKKAVVISDANDDVSETNARLAKAAFDIIKHASGHDLKLGVGWGRTLQNICAVNAQPLRAAFAKVIPLCGGVRSAHSFEHGNGLAYELALKIGASARPIFFPATVSTEAELKAIEALTEFAAAQAEWERLDALIFEVEETNTSSAAGTLLGYAFDANGVFQPGRELRLCIPVAQIRSTNNKMALADAQLSPAALYGALKTGVVTHAVMTEKAAKALLAM